MKALLSILILSQLSALAAPGCCTTNLPPAQTLSDKSIYQLDARWTTDYGKPLALHELKGRVQVVTLFFASCTYACPILVHDLRKIEAALQAAGHTNVGFVLVTFDTQNDTVERLHNYRKLRDLNSNWTLLRGEGDEVAELAALLGVKFRKEPSGQFAHSNLITVLNAKGEIIHQQFGLNTEPGPTVAAITQSLTLSR